MFKRVLLLIVTLLSTTLSCLVAAQIDNNELRLTELDRYVRAPDNNYRYSVIDTVNDADFTTYILEMISQQWLTEAEVNLPVWEHYMTVTVPRTVESDIGFLYITGGSKSNSAPVAAPDLDVTRALRTNTVVTTLYMVPNQPLVFTDDGRDRTEDAIIAYTWDKHLRTGDDKWPLRLPMTKAAVRAMDTVTNFLAQAEQGSIEVDQFVVAGGSKRGWTTW
ncbi:MAG: PhoPQ-activated pathogenicity-related family protein, partial [Pseudomonadales bacterium]|nr:PhoPQ-activated pathogenicity-related family protein [Pseudomonadales bacterium]